MNVQIKTEGIVLKSIPFQEYDQILTLYTPDQGLVKFIVKRGRGKKSQLIGCLAPLTRVEVVYKNGRGDLGQCLEMSPLNQFQELRSHYDLLEKACEIVKTLSASQWPGKPSEPLYKLLLYYLERMTEAVDARSMVASFKLKVLRHEGLLHLHGQCLACSADLDSWHLADGETYCKLHAPAYAARFDTDDAAQIALLATTKSFQELRSQFISDELYNKVAKLFLVHFEKQSSGV